MDPLGDKKSNVELIDSMGSDLTVVNAARVSFAKTVTVMEERDKKLINYLAKHNHITPFFHPQVQMRIKMPIFVAREWFRHTVGFARNEVSRRYVDDEPDIFMPTELRARDKNLKQGSKLESVENNEEVAAFMADGLQAAVATYNGLLEKQVAPEVARMALPQSMYTEFIETGSLYAYARLCKLRLDPGAQKEIQLYAEAVDAILREKFPVSWVALMNAAGHSDPVPTSSTTTTTS